MPTFEAPIYAHDRYELGSGWHWIDVPFNAAEMWGIKSHIPIVGTVEGEPVRGTLSPKGGGQHLLHLSKPLLKTIGKRAGMTIKINIEFDPEPRPVEIPVDLEDALENNPLAKAFFFEMLPPSHRKGLIMHLNDAKTMETRFKRLDKMTYAFAYWKRLGKKPEAGQSVLKLPE